MAGLKDQHVRHGLQQAAAFRCFPTLHLLTSKSWPDLPALQVQRHGCGSRVCASHLLLLLLLALVLLVLLLGSGTGACCPPCLVVPH
jgi:hypothetical protein